MNEEDRKAKLLEMEKAQLMATLGMTLEDLPDAIAALKKWRLAQEKKNAKAPANQKKTKPPV
jgi:hypothetical protein